MNFYLHPLRFVGSRLDCIIFRSDVIIILVSIFWFQFRFQILLSNSNFNTQMVIYKGQRKELGLFVRLIENWNQYHYNVIISQYDVTDFNFLASSSKAGFKWHLVSSSWVIKTGLKTDLVLKWRLASKSDLKWPLVSSVLIYQHTMHPNKAYWLNMAKLCPAKHAKHHNSLFYKDFIK